jgi:hypothetical protein
LRRLFSWRIYLTFELFEWTADIFIIIRSGERARFLSSLQRENVNTNTHTHTHKNQNRNSDDDTNCWIIQTR